MGASIAGGLAIFHPQKVSKLVLGDTGPDGDPEGEERIYNYMKDWPDRLNSEEEAVEFVGSHLVDLNRGGSPRACAGTWSRRDPDGSYRMKLDPALVKANVERGVQALPPGESPLWPFIPQITPPTLIVRGSKTVYFPKACAERMVREMPDARLVEIDTGHGLFLEDLDAFYDAVRARSLTTRPERRPARPRTARRKLGFSTLSCRPSDCPLPDSRFLRARVFPHFRLLDFLVID